MSNSDRGQKDVANPEERRRTLLVGQNEVHNAPDPDPDSTRDSQILYTTRRLHGIGPVEVDQKDVHDPGAAVRADLRGVDTVWMPLLIDHRSAPSVVVRSAEGDTLFAGFKDEDAQRRLRSRVKLIADNNSRNRTPTDDGHTSSE